MSQSLFIFAKITPKADFFMDAKQAILEIIDDTRAETGCYRFDLFENEEGCLYLYEEWRDNEALAAHYEMEYTKKIFKRYENWLEKAVEIEKFSAINQA